MRRIDAIVAWQIRDLELLWFFFLWNTGSHQHIFVIKRKKGNFTSWKSSRYPSQLLGGGKLSRRRTTFSVYPSSLRRVYQLWSYGIGHHGSFIWVQAFVWLGMKVWWVQRCPDVKHFFGWKTPWSFRSWMHWYHVRNDLISTCNAKRCILIFVYTPEVTWWSLRRITLSMDPFSAKAISMAMYAGASRAKVEKTS